MQKQQTEEALRLLDNKQTPVPKWYKWGPYVAERAWGTVREDYSANGDAWSYFPFSLSHKKAYRWGEDGIAGWTDRYQVLVFAPAFWNGKDPILKERLFGLSFHEGNHGEDVKECYYYLDATPTHSYMKYLYKYPQAEFPYELLKKTNQHLSKTDAEYELTDTGVFAEGKYFDIIIEYAKDSAEGVCIRIEAFNRGDAPACLHMIPQLWFRNQWAWETGRGTQPVITCSNHSKGPCLIADDTSLASPKNLSFDYHLGKRYLYGTEGATPLFTDNETESDFVKHAKNAFHEKIIHHKETTNPEEKGTKACLHYIFEEIPAQGSKVLYLRLSPEMLENPFKDIESVFIARRKEADHFYASIHPLEATEEEKKIQRTAFAGMIWNKQFYFFDVHLWSKGDSSFHPPPPERQKIRNNHWYHLNTMRILSMPDKWEYPWFAAWDTAFHAVTFGLIDIEFAKEQIWLLLFDQFQHPNGAIPAYEWEFSDLNPPVQAWAAFKIYQIEKEKTGREDLPFLEKCFLKLLINFTFWVNKVDSSGCNIFEGGFLGLDNISLIDRSLNSAKDGILKQSDGTGWMAMFCLNLMRIALELSKKNPSYEIMATKFFQHFVYIADAIKRLGNDKHSMWSEEDGFFYDVLIHQNGTLSTFAVRSLVGLIPLYAVEILSEKELEMFPQMKKDFLWFIQHRQDLTKDCVFHLDKDGDKIYLLSLVSKNALAKILQYVWDPQEFRSCFGIRSLSKFHEHHPFVFQHTQVSYEPGHSKERIKGGNSNWRGPIWFPTNYLLIQSLKKFAEALGDHFMVCAPNETPVPIGYLPDFFANRLIALFTENAEGKRPCLGNAPIFLDSHFRFYPLFYEFYHGETGEGLGASHQTGWSGTVANLIDEFRS